MTSMMIEVNIAASVAMAGPVCRLDDTVASSVVVVVIEVLPRTQ
jgi:hypothetical protein